MKQTMDNQEQMDYKKLYEAEREKTEVLVSKIEESEKEIEELNFKLDRIKGSFAWKLAIPLRKGLHFYEKTRDRLTRYGSIPGIMRKVRSKLQERKNMKRHGTASFPGPEEAKAQRETVFPNMVKFSILTPLYNTPEKFLTELLDCVQAQTYQNWELCLSDGSGEDSSIAGILEEYTKKDSRIRVKDNKKQLHISDNTNVALDMATGDYIAFMDHDDLLTPDALYECVAELNEYPDTELIYTDEDKITMDGEEYFFPHFKSDFNPDMLCTTNYFCHLVVVKKELYQAAGKLNGEYDGAQDYDFVLRCVEKTDKIRHIPKILYHWRACEGSTAGSADNKSYIVDAGAKAVRAHYRRMGIEAEVIPTKYPGMYRTKYPVKQTPKISVIIPNKDHTDDLIKCLRSIREKNTYENIEILVIENNSQKKKTFKDYRRIMHEYPKVKVLYWKGEGFNYPEINQYGIDHICCF